ncbi:hypothetical protein N5K27_22430 [Pigmentiphaga sp. GD03639]|uniref:hypothetical protein n=1 Tax=Pigmentiphaga sp. GD03639 TaxID=2975354 RepID=UPI0024477987|nr:hypothetical protein [Pigmentiphaga sp. GD03639]MDH2239069.1 hypothetical protein [Pigmentiphaga sp. GD03639]
MAVAARVLVDAKYAENALTTQYTAVNVTALIDKFTGTNGTGAAVTLDVHIVPAGGTADATNLVVKAKSIAAGDAYTFPEVVGQILKPGDSIATLASAASAIVLRAAGRESS